MKEILKDIKSYYSDKITKYGVTPKGVDWNNEYDQILRFKKLLEIIDLEKFLIADLGCGYGRLFEYLSDYYHNFNYIGYDLSKIMIEKAKNTYKNAKFKHIKTIDCLESVDYIVASGIFNVKMKYSNKDWFSYIVKTLDLMNKNSKQGFAFNFLTIYSDKEYMREDLYYADPCFIFDFCKKKYSQNISLLHDYNLYEFTIIVRKEEKS
jgi:SAM-dependent methyltransferase